MFRRSKSRSSRQSSRPAVAGETLSASSRPAAVEPLEGRQLFAVAIAFVAPDTLVFTGNGDADVVNINDNGAGVISGSRSVVGGVVAPFGPVGGIRRVIVNTHGNTDRVSYNVTGDTLAGGYRSLSVSLGDGDDGFRFNATADIDLGPNAFVDVRASGGNGKDYMGAFYRGELDGNLRVTMSGGAGDDRMVTDAKMDWGSAGRFTARSYGDWGRDTIDMLARKANPADPVIVDALASGGADWDVVTRTPLAVADATCEVINVVP